MEENVKKPIWKKWWFWLIVIVIIIALGSSGNKDATTPSSSNGGNSNTAVSGSASGEPENVFKAGMYKIGSDMPAGEYVLIADRAAYFAVTSDSSGSLESIVANDNFSSRSIITVFDGQYLELKGCKAYPFAEAPAVDQSSSTLDSGMYKVGIDLPAGEYKVESSGMGYFEVSSNSAHDLNAIVANDNFSGSKYVSVSDGQYIKLNNAQLYLK